MGFLASLDFSIVGAFGVFVGASKASGIVLGFRPFLAFVSGPWSPPSLTSSGLTFSDSIIALKGSSSMDNSSAGPESSCAVVTCVAAVFAFLDLSFNSGAADFLGLPGPALGLSEASVFVCAAVSLTAFLGLVDVDTFSAALVTSGAEDSGALSGCGNSFSAFFDFLGFVSFAAGFAVSTVEAPALGVEPCFASPFSAFLGFCAFATGSVASSISTSVSFSLAALPFFDFCSFTARFTASFVTVSDSFPFVALPFFDFCSFTVSSATTSTTAPGSCSFAALPFFDFCSFTAGSAASFITMSISVPFEALPFFDFGSFTVSSATTFTAVSDSFPFAALPFFDFCSFPAGSSASSTAASDSVTLALLPFLVLGASVASSSTLSPPGNTFSVSTAGPLALLAFAVSPAAIDTLGFFFGFSTLDVMDLFEGASSLAS